MGSRAVNLNSRERQRLEVHESPPGMATAERPGIVGTLTRFVTAVRNAGVPISISESSDALELLDFIDITDRASFKAALRAALVKDHRHQEAFDTLFDIYFALRSERPWHEREAGKASSSSETTEGGDGSAESGPSAGGGGSSDPADLAGLRRMLLLALLEGDLHALRELAVRAVEMLAGMEPGRPAGGTYYLYRTLQQLDLESLSGRAMREIVSRARHENAGTVRDLSPLQERFLREDVLIRVELFREFVQGEIRRRLVEDRGPEALAKSIQRPLPEDIEFMHATSSEIQQMRRALYPLTRKLAARLRRARRNRLPDRLDFRHTVRSSLSYGGVPVYPRFKKPHPSKPEIFLLCDVSGSVANFARFTLQLVYAMSNQFSRVRSWVFIDGIDETTEYFEKASDLLEATHRINNEAKIVWVDGHSDYGHVLTQFWNANARDITPKTTVIILGDARNNYHSSQAWVLAEIKKRARRLIWLNPEPKAYWNTGDSIIGEYAQFCDGVWECRNLRQLEKFVSSLTG